MSVEDPFNEESNNSDHLSCKNVIKLAPFKARHSVIFASLVNHGITAVDIQKLLEAGLNAVRIRMPQQTHEDRLRLMNKIEGAIHTCCKKYGVKKWPVATCVELKTHSAKTGIIDFTVNNVSVLIKQNTNIILTCDVFYFDKCSADRIFIDNFELGTEVKVGMEISIEGDRISLICKEVIDDKTIKAFVVKGGELFSMRNACFRCLKSTKPFINPIDIKILEFVKEHNIDVIVVNYVDSGEEVRKIKNLFGMKSRRPILLCGVSTEGTLDNIDDIAKEADGIVLSREYLPHEVRKAYQYRINNIQKWVLAKCHQAGKPVYISGGLVPDPTKQFNDCDLSDITNALLDGVTGFILKEQYATVDHVIATVQQLNTICCDVEPFCYTNRSFWKLTEQYMVPVNAAEAGAIACVRLANRMKAKLIILPTVSGRTARALTTLKPLCFVLAVCTNIRVANMLRVFKSMVPVMYSGEQASITTDWKISQATNARINYAVEYGMKKEWLKYKDSYVVLKRHSEDWSYCDEVTVWQVASSLKPMIKCDE